MVTEVVKNSVVDFTYRGHLCRTLANLSKLAEREMEIQHFSHQHPLILRQEKEKDEQHIVCFGCHEPISSCPFYRCDHCLWFLDKTCAELPEKISHHPIHPQHPLTLHAAPPNPYRNCICDACGRTWNSFTYHCSDCNFDIDINCTSLPYTIQFGDHQHQLVLWPKPASFSCDACGTDTHPAGVSYRCTASTCRLWVHRDCSSLPGSIKIPEHDHILFLTYSLHMEFSRYRYRIHCKICNEELLKKCWVYYCAGCKYATHSKCATTERQPEPSRDSMAETNVGNHQVNVIQMPIPNEEVQFISHFFKEIMNLGKNESATEFKHFSHHHQLTLFDELGTDEICDGCARSISARAPCYGCAQCKFFLHKWCANLPNEVHHSVHSDHQLTLLAKAPDAHGLFKCSVCSNFSNGFAFHCAPCNLYLDVKCGSYPSTIKHEGHKHLLTLRLNVQELKKKKRTTKYSGADRKKRPNMQERCSACNEVCLGFIYECAPCRFKVDIQCALLPRVIWHRYDKEHPLILTYSLFEEDPSEEFYCEFCEGEIYSNFWFYHCAHCDLSFHTRCLFKVDDAYSNVKFGGTVELNVHPHPLTLAKMAIADKPPCDHCGDPCNELTFECKQCSYNLHTGCASTHCN